MRPRKKERLTLPPAIDSRCAVADVEVSIVSLLGGSQLATCLAALTHACAGLDWRLTLVDNSPSGLDLTSHLQEIPEAIVLRSEGRRGFGANQNLALAGLVRDGRARYALVLNDDTEPDAGSVTTLVRYADRHPAAGAVAPVIADPTGVLEPSVVAWPTLRGQALVSLFPRRTAPATVAHGWLNGACMLVRTAALAEVGLFDPKYFLFFEETDLCRRLTDVGWRTEHCSDARVVHHKSQTTRTGSRIELERQSLRSQYLYFRKHHGRLTAGVLNALTRCGLLARTAKVTLEVAGRRTDSESSTARGLLALALSRPNRPAGPETESRADLS